MGDWSQLPKELLQLISERLDDSALYLIRFRSVCSTWRSSIPKPRHLPVKFPPILDKFNNHLYNNNDPSTFSLYKRTLFLITPPQPPHPQQTLRVRPWLIEIGPDSHGQTRLWHPLLRGTHFPFHSPHVLDFSQHRVLHLGHEFPLADYPPLRGSICPRKAVVATWQGNSKDGFVLLTILVFRTLALFRRGDERWTVIPDRPTPYDDVCVFKGRPCAVCCNGRTVIFRPDMSFDLVAEPEPVCGGDRKYLVESEGELLLVDKYSDEVYEYLWSLEKVVRLDVYRLEEKEKRWVQLTTLGDRILFLGDACAFSASASDLCVGEGNCVIFRDRDGYGIRVFHLDDGRFSHLYDDDPGYFKLFWPPPDWVELH